MRKRGQLLVNHLENVSWEIMEYYPEIIRSMIRNRSGVYALYSKGSLHYVGLASNLMRRLKAHLSDQHEELWDRFSVYLTAKDDHMKELEALLLRIIKPKGNIHKGRFAASIDLKRTLKKEITAVDFQRRTDIIGIADKSKRGRKRIKKAIERRELSGVFKTRTLIKGWRKGYEYRAHVRKDGTIRYGTKIYQSPSGAAKAAVRCSTNGWRFWHYKDKKGEWVQLRRIVD